MPETVLVLCENGSRIPHDLPLPEGLAQRVAKGEAQVLGPCDQDGNLLNSEPEPEPANPAPAKKATTPRQPRRTQDAGGQSADDDPPANAPSK